MIVRVSSAITLSALTLAAAPACAGNALASYTVVGDAIPAALADAKGDSQRGRAIVAGRSIGLCVMCHSAPLPEVPLQGNIGPDLKGAGGRWSEGQLRLRMVDSSRLNPQTIMPPYYRVDDLVDVSRNFRDKPILNAQQIEDVVAYLVTLRD
jgi:L-cysteine S-thiosulfotransferase